MRTETTAREVQQEPLDLESVAQSLSTPRKYGIGDKVMLAAPGDAGSRWATHNYKRGEVAAYGDGDIPGHPELGRIWVYSVGVQGLKQPEEWPEPWLVKVG